MQQIAVIKENVQAEEWNGVKTMSNQKYQCCFCGEIIESNEIDVTGLIVISNWNKNKELQQEQQMFCHIECLKNKLAKNVPLYIADI